MKAIAKPNNRGFTLVELMVVVVIIAVLASLAFVGGNRILNKAREASAISNLRQLGQGLLTIQSDGGVLAKWQIRGAYPPEAGYDDGGVLYTWAYEVAEQMGYGHYDSDNWGAKFIWTTDPNESAFHDPTADWEIEDDGTPNKRTPGTLWKTSHFAYNGSLGLFLNHWKPGFQKGDGDYTGDISAMPSQTTAPSVLIMLAQAAGADQISDKEQKADGHMKCSNSLNISPWQNGGKPAFRIRGGGNCMFADGHVGWVNTSKLYEGSWDCPNLIPDSKGDRKNLN